MKEQLLKAWMADLGKTLRGPEVCSRYLDPFQKAAPKAKKARPKARRKRIAPPADGNLTAAEAAAKLGCSVKTMMGHVRSGALRYVVIGHGRKRPRKMFTNADLADFTASQTRKDAPALCPSSRTDARHSSGTTFRSEVIAFSALRNARANAKLKK